MSRFSELRPFVESVGHDFLEFREKGNKTAGKCLRKKMQELTKRAQTIREDVQARKKAEEAA